MTMVAIQVGQAAIKYFVGGGDTAGNPLAPVPVSTDGSAGLGAAPSASGRVQAPQAPNLLPLWEPGTVFDAHLYVTGTGHLQIDTTSSVFPHTSYQQLKLGDWSWAHEWNTEVVLPRVCEARGYFGLMSFEAAADASHLALHISRSSAMVRSSSTRSSCGTAVR